MTPTESRRKPECGTCPHSPDGHRASDGACEVRYVDGARCYCPGYRAHIVTIPELPDLCPASSDLCEFGCDEVCARWKRGERPEQRQRADWAEMDAILKEVLEEYVDRRHGVIGSAEPEWFRTLLVERGYRLTLIADSEAAK